MVYSPLDALRLALGIPRGGRVVRHRVRDTAPSTALILMRSNAEGLTNFSVFCNHVTVAAGPGVVGSPDLRSMAYRARPCLHGDWVPSR